MAVTAVRGLVSLLSSALLAAGGAAQAVPTARAGSGSGAPVRLPEAIAAAVARNPDLVIARLRVDSARAERWIAGAVPNPTLSATPGNPSQYSAQIPLDIGPARHYRTKASREGQSAAVLDRRDAERQVVFSVRQAFYDLLLTDSLRALADEQVGIFRQLLQADSARLRAGTIAERDVLTTRLQLAHAVANAARADASDRAARLALQTLLGIARPDTAFRIAGRLGYRPVDVSPESLVALALERRPDLMASSLRVTQSESLRSLAAASLVPIPTVGAAYQPAQPFPSGSHYAPAVGITVPVFDLFRGERARATAGLAAARISRQRTQTQVQVDVAGALDAYRSVRVLAERYAGGLLADASTALDAARYAYSKGATSLLDLLDAVRTYGDTRSDYLTAAHDYWISVFALERATGADFVSDDQ
jgi:cobalt-zinc-cadmium efflux system outer membrane protein